MTLTWEPWPDPSGLTDRMQMTALPDGTSLLISRDQGGEGWAASMHPVGGLTTIVQPDGTTLPMREENCHWFASRREAEVACEKAAKRRLA
jgi:hypothetical protein